METIKSIQVFGDQASCFFFEIKYKLTELQKVLKSKESLKNTIKCLEFKELDEIGFLQQLKKHSKYFPELYQIPSDKKQLKSYIIVNQKQVYFQLSEFFNIYEELKKHFIFVPCLSGEENPNYKQLAQNYFYEKIEKEFQYNNDKQIKKYFEFQLQTKDQSQKFNLIGELYYKQLPKTTDIFIEALMGQTQTINIDYLKKEFTVKRKQFIQLQTLENHKEFMDENCSINPDKPGCIALINKGYRDSNNFEFFITLDDLSEQRLNNVCIGRFIYGMEDLLNHLQNQEDSDNLGLKINQSEEYKFTKQHFIQKNGIMQLINNQALNQLYNTILNDKLEQQRQKNNLNYKKQEEADRQARKEEEKRQKQNKINLQKELYKQKRQVVKSVSISQLKQEYKLKKNLQTSISNIRDLDKQQPIEMFFDQLKVTREAHEKKLQEENQKLLDQYQENIDKHNLQFTQEEDEKPYKLQIREQPQAQIKTQDNSVFNIQNVRYTPPPKVQEQQQQNENENEKGENAEQNDGQDQGQQINIKQEQKQEHFFEVLEPFQDLMYDDDYNQYVFQSQYIRVGKNCRTVNLLEKSNKQRFVLKQFNTKKSYDEERELRQRIDKIIEESSSSKNDDLSNYVAQVISYNDQNLTIIYEGGETTLGEYHQQMMKNQIYWFQDRPKKSLNQIILQLSKIQQAFNNNKIYIAPNIRCDNLILTYDEDYIDLKLKIVDLGFSSIDEEFDYVKAQIPAFAPFDINQNQIKDQDERFVYEQAWLGKLILWLMNSSISGYENYKNQFLKEIQHSQFDVFVQPFNQNVKELIEKQKQYFDQFHLELLNSLLLDKQKDKTKRVLDTLRKEAKIILQNIYDYDELVRQQMIDQLYLPAKFPDQYELLDKFTILSNLEFYEKILQITKPFIQNNETLLPDVIFHNILALDTLNWIPKIKKFINYLEEKSQIADIENSDKSLFSLIQLVKARVENPDLTNSDNQAIINDLVTKYNQTYIRDFGENDYKSVKALLQSAQIVQKAIGKVTNKQGAMLFFRQNGEKIKNLIKSGLKLSPYEEAQNLFLAGYGFESPTEEQTMQILKDNEEALEILKKNNLQKTQLFCDILENINSLNYASHSDEDVYNKSQKTLLSYQMRALGFIDRNCVRNFANITIYQNKNKIKFHLTNFEVNEQILYQSISLAKAKFTIDEMQQEDLHLVKSNCNQENYVQHFRDYNNKQQEFEQQDRLDLALMVAKAGLAINLIHLQAKKDFEENKQYTENRISIMRQKIKINNQINKNEDSNDYTEDSSEKIQEILINFINANQENFNSHDIFFYLNNIFPFHNVRLEEKYLEFLLEMHRLKEQLEKMKSDKKYMLEFGIINYYAAYCNLKLDQRHIMSYYLYLIEEVVGPEFHNSGLQRKKTQPPLRTLERFQVAAHIFATHYYKPEPTKYLYMNLV